MITFSNKLSFLVQYIPKHNILIIDENMNVHIRKCENYKFCLHNYPEFSLENKFVCLNLKIKRGDNMNYPNNSKA